MVAGGAALRCLFEPLPDQADPVLVLGIDVRGREPAERVATLPEEAAALVRLQHHVELVRRGDEGEFHLVQPSGERRGRVELQLLEERKLLRHTVQPACLDVGAVEVEPQPPERVEHRVLRRQRVHLDGVEVALVRSSGDHQFRAHPHGHAGQLTAAHGGDRRLPRDHELERHGDELLCGHTHAVLDDDTVELTGSRELVVAALHLDPGHQRQRDLTDLRVVAAALDPHLPGDGLSGHGVRGVQHRVDGRAADAERAEQPFEHGRCPPWRSGYLHCVTKM